MNTSFMVPFWSYTELSSAPILTRMCLVATLVQRMLFIALMTATQVSPKSFSPLGGFSIMYSEHHIICTVHSTHSHYNTWYTTHIFLYITFMHNIHTFFFTCLLFFSAGWLPLALDVRYNVNF